MARFVVIQTEELEAGPAAWLAERCELIVCPHDDPRLEQFLPRADGMVVRTYTRVDEGLLSRGSRLRVVGRAGVALENFDLAACRRRGVRVVHTPGANTRAVVEFVTALMLDVLRPRVRVDEAVPAAAWHRLRRDSTAEKQLSDLTLGVWGFGRIGSSMARVARALDMRCLYNDLLEIPESNRHGAEPVDVEMLLKESDIVSIHVDFRPSNHHLVGRSAFARMKPDVVVINTSRGFVLDPAAAAEFLGSHPGARGAFDVHDPMEPIPPGYPLLGLSNAILTPHLASGTVTAKTNMSWVVRDVWRVLNGEEPEFEAVYPGR